MEAVYTIIIIHVNIVLFALLLHYRWDEKPCKYSIICLCPIILISSEKKSLHNNKYYVYISYKFYSTKGIIFALLLNYSWDEMLFMLI